MSLERKEPFELEVTFITNKTFSHISTAHYDGHACFCGTIYRTLNGLKAHQRNVHFTRKCSCEVIFDIRTFAEKMYNFKTFSDMRNAFRELQLQNYPLE